MTDDHVVARWAAHGLVDPDARPAGLADVLAFYESVGVDPAALVGTPPDQLIRVVNRSMRQPGRHLGAEDVRAGAGLDEAAFLELCRAAAIDPDDRFGEDDVDAFRSLRLAGAAFSADELLHVVRVLRQSMDRLAHALTALIRMDVLSVLDAVDAPEVDFARKNHETAQLVPLAFAPLRAVFLRSLEAAIAQSDAARSVAAADGRVSAGSGLVVPVCVGFVDIAGFTTVVESVDAAELARYVLDFEVAAHELVGRLGGQLVKLIGDEVMFATVDAERAVAIAAALIERFDDRHGRPSAGVCAGDAVTRGGDYYGRPVNLAARVTALAGPGEVLTDAATAAAADGWAFEPIGEHPLKGFQAPVALCRLTGHR